MSSYLWDAVGEGLTNPPKKNMSKWEWVVEITVHSVRLGGGTILATSNEQKTIDAQVQMGIHIYSANCPPNLRGTTLRKRIVENHHPEHTQIMYNKIKLIKLHLFIYTLKAKNWSKPMLMIFNASNKTMVDKTTNFPPPPPKKKKTTKSTHFRHDRFVSSFFLLTDRFFDAPL